MNFDQLAKNGFKMFAAGDKVVAQWNLHYFEGVVVHTEYDPQVRAEIVHIKSDTNTTIWNAKFVTLRD